MNTGSGREEIERDYDPILFAAPTRRLADKTQVFPLEKNDSVRTRLTHSHEVSNLARSIGVRLAFEHAETVFGENPDSLSVKRNVPSLLAAVGLAHDLGNPPFGHQGEEAIKQWFNENNEVFFGKSCHPDFLNFDGNAQTIRLLTRLQILNDEYGLNLTCGTLAALMKYPSFWDSEQQHYGKFGIFESEREIIKDVWKETGLREGIRHPLAYVMEACDDIAYSVIDAEDTVKKDYASFYDLVDYLDHHSDGDNTIDDVVKVARKKNNTFKRDNLSSKELNDLSMQMFRVKAIFEMVFDVTDTFVSNIENMMNESIAPDFVLIKSSKSEILCKTLKQFNFRHGFQNREVLKLELEGNNYIKSMMDMLSKAINEHDSEDPFAKYAYGRISENYRRAYETTGRTPYDKCQLLCDTISGMTDTYLISLHDELRALHDGFRSQR
jgi:dGTPase